MTPSTQAGRGAAPCTRRRRGRRTRGPAAATWRAWAVAGAALLLGSCAAPLPPVTWLRLPDELAAPALAPPDERVAGQTWQLVVPVALPGHLDRDAVLVPRGAAGLQPLGGVRWAEPLRDAVPRLLRDDLARALGTPAWVAPLPPGVRPTRQLRVEIGALDVAPEGRGVVLRARWSVADAGGQAPPRLGQLSTTVAAASPDADALAVAHRRALRELAAAIAAQAVTAP
ncbi:MAG: PqiC family protein [Rubrivivax sp.]|jgi:hypothetical protein|nr:PqiC family protein [Rubrivivax sp.]